jgi:hypothetical protein
VGDRLFVVAGNHDFERDGASSRFESALQSLHCPPERRFRFCLGDAHVHLVGVSLPWRSAAVSSDDLHWCGQRFGAARRSAIRVFAVHQPLFPVAGRVGMSLDAEPAARDMLRRSLDAWGVRLVLCGHEHLYARRDISPGITQVISGGGGAQGERAVFGHADVVRPGPHFVVLTATGRGLTLEARTAEGHVFDRIALSEAA